MRIEKGLPHSVATAEAIIAQFPPHLSMLVQQFKSFALIYLNSVKFFQLLILILISLYLSDLPHMFQVYNAYLLLNFL